MLATRWSTGIVLGVLALLVGCQQPMNMEQMMTQPPRPTELDRLNIFVGQWEGTMEMTMPGTDKPTMGKGVNTVSWDADKWVLVERFEGTMGEKNTRYASVGIWTWDPKINKFRTYWFDNYGASGTGMCTYDEANKTWRMSSKGKSSAGSTCGEGTTKIINNNTMEWNYTEWDGLKLAKCMEMKATSKRK